jgi:two-component system LytT family response regulator
VPIKAIIIDDEKPARMILQDMLNSFDEIHIVGEAENGFEALKIIQELNPQLLFLDIQMPKISGFELLEVLDDKHEIIFTTAYSEFAIKAFEKNAVDYLLKPIDPERLKEAINKVKNRLSQGQTGGHIKLVENRLEATETLDRVVVKTGTKIHIISLQEIIRIEADDDYVAIHTAEQKFLKKQTMKYFERHLSPEDFIRVHRSHIISISQLEKIEPYSKDNYLAILENGDKIPISTSGYQALRKRLDF